MAWQPRWAAASLVGSSASVSVLSRRRSSSAFLFVFLTQTLQLPNTLTGSGIIRLKVEGSRFRTSIQKANSSSKTFGLMGGMYTFMACASRKIRGKDDAVNLAIAGCASGIALGWEGGPMSALQSCAGMAAFSWFFDGKRLNTDIEEAS
mmetsp:Transcript_4096/g.11898  ORF Transcript_4096/g.11898 Transcript_4096/m.11898 type:complete len:149 (-) Transcript_4096:169-615(-)